MMGEESLFLSTLRPERRDRQAALAVVLVSVLVFITAAPFAKTPLLQVPAFLPIYQSALVINEVITAVLLFGQYAILRSRALLVLAGGYLFSAVMAVCHALSFPGLFAPTGLLSAGPQTTAWLYFLWHGGFPLFIIGYALLRNRGDETAPPGSRLSVDLLSCALAVFAVAGLLTLVATSSHDRLPAIMSGNVDAPAKVVVATIVWMLSLLALVVLWVRRPHSVLDLWLMIVMCVWIFDTALASVLNHGRYDLGWYAGRVYGLLAATFVLVMLLLENGKLYARLVIAHDVEQTKNAELRELTGQLESVNNLLAERNEQLGEASRLKSEFLANMSHELRTPLNAIIGFSEVLKDGLLGEITREQRDYVADIFSSGRHLLSLINDILDLSKVEAGRMTLDVVPLDVGSLLKSSLAIVKEQALAQHIQLQLHVEKPLGNALLDERKTKQIVFNLLSNGVKFSPDGGQVVLRARRLARSEIESWTAPGEAVRLKMPLPSNAFDEFLEISVEDSGIGIDAEDAPRLFQPFSQLDSSLAREAEGTGLGLALVRKLSQLQGGTVALASTPGHGSRFIVWLPWRETSASPDALADATLNPSRRSSVRKVALVIEDNEYAAELIRLQLEPAGFEIVCAANATEGLDLLACEYPDVIVLDVLLPDMDGWDLLARIKAPESPTAHIPIIITSIVADTKKGFSLGASAVLQKPIARDDLINALQHVGLTRKSQAEDAGARS